ncbi:YbaK/EbsC family protein [uncultured Draconibacterium sp.]|uniref:aminoacyl-tRNA deacylase n=1 Tax=uncultured Draconibacterium sp. TaxID=1573823 RepID=UPI0029C6B4E9|nr:YbaK/EbsC family protein [uncultured Draconibacterium sp.]
MNTIESITKVLIKSNVGFEIISHNKAIKTKEDAEAYFQIEETAPTLLLKTDKGIYSLIVSGIRAKVDFKQIKKLLKCKNLTLMDKNEVQEMFKMEVGSIPLVGLDLPTIFDNILLDYEFVYGGCADFYKTLKIRPEDLTKVNNVVLFFD